MDQGAKLRSQILKERLDDVVAAHRASGEDHTVVVVVGRERQGEIADALLPDGRRDGTALGVLPVARARQWLADVPATAKWDEWRSDAMDVAVVAAEGVTVMRLTAR
jgi:hypothetical protein